MEAASFYSGGLNMEPKKIRFIDTSYRTLFSIEDGGEIEITLNDGFILKEVCKYIDDYHLYVGRGIYHIREFAEVMERTGQTYKPVSNNRG
jgi:hypothetical protein